MFIKEGVVELLPLFPYQLDYLRQDLGDLQSNPRAFLSKNNAHYKKFSEAACRYVCNYISSQHRPILKDFIPRKFHMVAQVDDPDTTYFFNTTYFDRVCQVIFVPIEGEIVYNYGSLEGDFKLEVGKAYAVNTRAPRMVKSMSPDFKCFVSMWIDFDLSFYLKEYDGSGVCERKKDEFFPATT